MNSQGATTSADLWSFSGVKIVPGPGGTALLHKSQTGQKMMVRPDLAQALQHCGPFRTLDAHTRIILEQMPSLREHGQSVQETLETVKSKGLLEHAEASWSRLTAEVTTESPDTCRLFILTCDRPKALKRIIASLALSDLPAEIEGLWIIDDSRDPESVSANAEVIASAEKLDFPMAHFNINARTQLLAALHEAHPDLSTAIRFLFDRDYWGDTPTHGMARNFALALSHGCRAIVMDDDILVQAIQPPLEALPLRFGTPNQREAVFYQSPEALEKHVMPYSQAPMPDMLRWLGKSLGPLLRQHWQSTSAFSGTQGEAVIRLTSSSPVVITQCGTWGDTGTTSGNWLFHIPSASQKRILAEPNGIEPTLSKRCAWFGYRGPTISQYGVMSAITGLAHDKLLPPYLPAGRNEDVMFGIMTQRLHPDSIVVNTGWAAPHLPLEERQERTALTSINTGLSVSLLADWLGREPEDQWGLQPVQRLSGMAEQIDRLAGMQKVELEQLVSHLLLSKRSGLLNSCLEQIAGLNAAGLDGLPGTDRWQSFLQGSRESLLESIQAVDTSPIADSLDQTDVTVETLQRMGRDFAEALRVWPTLVKTAHEAAAKP